MSYKEKPILKLYKYENNTFVLKAIIDDYMECSFERNLYQAGSFTISINYNIPNAQLFQRGLFVQFGSDPYDFGEIISISDAIGSDGKGSQLRTITGYDSRYIFKRRVIKNMNSNGLWVMTGKGEIVLRSLISDQCGSSAELKRRLPVSNTIPSTADAIGKEYSVSEQFSNLYEVCKTIATQSEIGWRLRFNGSNLILECYEGENRAQTVQFSTSFDSLANGQFTDSSDSYTNAIYVGGKGQNDDRDIYEGEDGAPEGLDRYESWDNQSNMTTEDEYEAEALSMLTQYGQTITVSGNGLAKSPYIYKEEYNVGDIITLAFSGKSAAVQILSVTEHWAFGQYSINFSFGKPQNNIQDQLQLILRKIQTASEKSESTDSVRWYTIPTDTEMPKADVTYRTIGFIGNVGNGATFKLYLDNEKTGAKTYHIYFKQLAGAGKLTLTTGVTGASNLVLNSGTYVAIVYVDENGNITSQGMTATNTIQTGNNQPATSSGVAGAISDEASARNTAITNAINALDVASVGGSGKYLSAISETDGKISATVGNISGTVTSGDNAPVSGGAVADILSSLPTDAVLHYSFDDLPDYPDGTADVRLLDNNTYQIQSTNYAFRNIQGSTFSNVNGNLQINIVNSSGGDWGVYIFNAYLTGKILKLKINVTAITRTLSIWNGIYGSGVLLKTITTTGIYVIEYVHGNTASYQDSYILCRDNGSSCTFTVEQIYIGDGSYSTPVIDNANGQNNAVNNGGIAVKGVSGKGIQFLQSSNAYINANNKPLDGLDNWTLSFWLNLNKGVEATSKNPRLYQFGLLDYCYCDNFYIGGNGKNFEFVTYEDNSHIISVRVDMSQYIGQTIFVTVETEIDTESTSTKRVYINGVLKAQATGSIIEKPTYSSWSIGDKTVSQHLENTMIDDFQIFGRALTEKEVLALYYNKANTPKYYSFADYRLDNM